MIYLLDDDSDDLKTANGRIAEFERELTEQARLNGMGSEREAALLAKVERLERENGALQLGLAKTEEQLGYARKGRESLADQLAAAQATIRELEEYKAMYEGLCK